jgi:hypothetical protein
VRLRDSSMRLRCAGRGQKVWASKPDGVWRFAGSVGSLCMENGELDLWQGWPRVRCTMYDVQCTMYSAVLASEGVGSLVGVSGMDSYVRKYVCGVCVCIKVSLVAVGSVGDEAWGSWIDDASTRSMVFLIVRQSLR